MLALQDWRQTRDGGTFKEGGQRELRAKGPFHAREQPHRHKGIPAELKEADIHPNARVFQDPFKEQTQAQLQSIPRTGH